MKNVIELLEEAKLNFEVQKQPSYIIGAEGEYKDTGMFGLVNQVNDATYGMVSDQYEVLQNETLAELSIRLAEHIGAKKVTADSFKGGKNVSFNVKEKETILEYPKRGDVISTGIKITNIHGGGPIKVMNESMVLSCTNGMVRSVKSNVTSIRHSKNMVEMLEQLLFANDAAVAEQETMLEEIQRMINAPITADNIAHMVESVLGVNPALINTNGTSDVYSGKKVVQTQSLLDSFREEMDYKGASVWGLLNGVTHFTSHKAGSDKHREISKVFGSLAAMDKKAYDFALSLV